MVIKFMPPKHLMTFRSDRGFIHEKNGNYYCSYVDILGFSHIKRFCVLGSAIEFMKDLGYTRIHEKA